MGPLKTFSKASNLDVELDVDADRVTTIALSELSFRQAKKGKKIRN